MLKKSGTLWHFNPQNNIHHCTCSWMCRTAVYALLLPVNYAADTQALQHVLLHSKLLAAHAPILTSCLWLPSNLRGADNVCAGTTAAACACLLQLNRCCICCCIVNQLRLHPVLQQLQRCFGLVTGHLQQQVDSRQGHGKAAYIYVVSASLCRVLMQHMHGSCLCMMRCAVTR